MIDEKATDSEDRVLSLWGLAAGRDARSTPCPADEELAAFIDNLLVGSQRNQILFHLNHCPDCYHHWLEITSYASTSELTSPDTVQVAAETPVSGLEKSVAVTGSYTLFAKLTTKVQRLFAPLSGHWHIAATAAAASILVITLFIDPGSSGIDNQISESYVTATQANGARLSAIARNLPLPWETAALGFAQAESAPPKRAFAAGLWFGRAALLQSAPMPLPDELSPPEGKTWQESPWQDFFAYGRWSVLLWAQAQSKQADADWDTNKKVLRQLRNNFVRHSANEAYAQEAVDSLDRLDSLLDHAQRRGEPQDYATLSRTLRIAMEYFAPHSL